MTPTDVNMHPVTLAFSDPQIEAGFRRAMEERQVVFGRVALGVGAVFVVVFALLDVLLGGDATRFCLSVRFGVMLPAVLVGLLMLSWAPTQRWGTAAQLVPTVIAGLAIIAMTQRLPSPAAEQYYAGIIVVLVFGHALTDTRFVHVSAAALTVIAAYVAVELGTGARPALLSNVFFLVAAELALAAGSYLHELQRRRLHLQTLRLERLSADLEEQALLDPLTGLGNRRALERRLSEQRAEVSRYAVPTTLLLADLDRFKHVNDQLGHPRGDAFLVAFARRIEGVLRVTDLAFRYGGDEFLIVLPHTQVSEAATVAQRLILAAKDLALEFGVADRGVSCSVGLAPVRPEVEGDPLGAVDAALYAAKTIGGEVRIA